jgi:hypothetical protein
MRGETDVILAARRSSRVRAREFTRTQHGLAGECGSRASDNAHKPMSDAPIPHRGAAADTADVDVWSTIPMDGGWQWQSIPRNTIAKVPTAGPNADPVSNQVDSRKTIGSRSSRALTGTARVAATAVTRSASARAATTCRIAASNTRETTWNASNLERHLRREVEPLVARPSPGGQEAGTVAADASAAAVRGSASRSVAA